jgi:hypothetical protein
MAGQRCSWYVGGKTVYSGRAFSHRGKTFKAWRRSVTSLQAQYTQIWFQCQTSPEGWSRWQIRRVLLCAQHPRKATSQ